MKTTFATFALMSLTGAIGISQDETAKTDIADVGNVLLVASHICIDGDSDAYPGAQTAVDTVAEQKGITGDQVCDGLLQEIGEGYDGLELAQAEAELFGGLVKGIVNACRRWKCF